MFKKISIVHYFLFALISIVLSLGLYVFIKYDVLQEPIKSVEIVYGNEVSREDIPIIYISGNMQSKINFTTVYKFQETRKSIYECHLDKTIKSRRLRLYFAYPNRKLSIKEINLKATNKEVSVPLKEFKKKEGIICIEQPNELILEVVEKNGYIELPNDFIYSSDFKNIYQLILPLLAVLILIILWLKSLKPINIGPMDISSITISLLVLSIFLPAPFFNIALILMVILNLTRISWTSIKRQKGNILIIGFFIIYLLNNLFISEESYRQFSTVERFLPFLALGVLLPSISERKFLALFPISAFVIGFGFLLTSIFDVYIHQNYEFMSFESFTKYLHPVYFSYLLFFSICYLDINYIGKPKYILEFILFVFLVFSGSKIVLTLSLLVILFNFFKNRKTFYLLVPLIIIIVLFSPLKNRFNDILNHDDLSILSEKHIENSFDTRINGLSLRLIIWREALATMNGVDFLIGKGVTKGTDRILEQRLVELGLTKHKNFNPHNQYVDTFWRTGLLGLAFLLLIPLYNICLGIKKEDLLLVIFSIFMMVVMLTESIFGRVNGIYFFTIVLILLINSNALNENRNIRHKGYTQ